MFVKPQTNEIYHEGDDVVNLNLSKALMRIASEGIDYIYKGEGATKISSESLEHGGILSRKDLEEYRVKWRPALTHAFLDRDDKTYTLHMPPPPSCAIMVGMILNIVNEYEKGPVHQDTYSPSRLAGFNHKAVEAMKHAFARKHMFGDSAKTSRGTLYKLLNPHWGLKMRNLISPTNTYPASHYTSLTELSDSEDSGTTNVVAISRNGDVVIASSSLNDPFGNGIVSETLGFALNNHMLSFSMTENGIPRGGDYGNIIVPNKRPLTFLSPIIVLDNDENFKMAIAASGGARIPTSIALILMRHFWINYSLSDATIKLRYHHQLQPNLLYYEGENKTYTFEFLRAYGHKMVYVNTQWPHVTHIARWENGTLATFTDLRENI